MKGKYLQFCLGVVAGGLLFSTTATAADYLTARATSQRFYLNGQPVQFEAYEIHGNNFVKLRDIGQAVDFGVTYDGSTNSVHIDSNAHYEQEVTAPVPSTTPTPSSLTEETVQTAIRNLRSVYPTGTEYPAPYISASNTPYGVSSTYCAGWAVLCSDTAFGSLPWRCVDRPSWNQIRPGDLIEYRNSSAYHVVVVLERTDDYIKVTESGNNNETRWGGQYFKWWLEEQPTSILRTRYPE